MVCTRWILSGTTALALLLGAWGAPARAQQPTPVVLRETYRLGFEGNPIPGGVQIVSIQPESPLLSVVSLDNPNQRGSLELGDVIAEVDGKPIERFEDYYKAMDETGARGGKADLSILELRTGAISRWQVQGAKTLVPANPGASLLRKAHFLSIGLTGDPNLKPGVEKSLLGWNLLADSVHPQRRGEVRELRDNNCRADLILSTIDAMRVASRDAIVCYYAGHGNFDPARAAGDPSGGHYFNIAATGDLMRRDLWNHLAGKRARLTVLITDTCSLQGAAFPQGMESYLQERTFALGFSSFESLLFEYRGELDLSGTDQGQVCVFDGDIGGWFTASAIEALRSANDWDVAFDRIKANADEDYIRRRDDLLARHVALDPQVEAFLKSQQHITPVHFHFSMSRDDASVYENPTRRTVRVPVARAIGAPPLPPPVAPPHAVPATPP